MSWPSGRTSLTPKNSALSPSPRALSWRGHGTVLLIDDELDAREVGQQVLERAGLKVLTAESGEDGLELFGAHAADITCVLLDLTMPGMDGLETYRRLHDIDPPVPVVLCSGYPEHAALERFADEGLAGFLEKPYDPADMLERVRDAIAQPPTRARVTPAAGPAQRGRA